MKTQIRRCAAKHERTVMKTLIYSILGIALIAGGITLATQVQKKPLVPSTPPRTEAAVSPAMADNAPLPPLVTTTAFSQTVTANTGAAKPEVVRMAGESGVKPVDPAIKQAIESLLTAPLNHEQRRDLLKQLNAAGKIDETISELQQLAAGDPHNANIATALGQANLEKAQTLMPSDATEGGILAMQAVKSFDSALSDDPANWEARFTRTAILSHYPAELNKGQEVVDQFSQLIDQQEKQPPQPQFAKTYALLGDQYQKLGNSEYAQATWQAGAALYPADATLRQRLAGQ
jgi:tetratricopeptide (TPR) repeat protein